MSEAPASRSFKMPVWKTAGAAYVAVLREFGMLVRAAWFWLIVATPIMFLIYWLVAPYEPGIRAPSTWDAGTIFGDTSGTWTTLLELVVSSSIAVAWHRRLLRGKPVASPAYFRLDAVVLSFWLTSVLIALPSLIPIQADLFVISAFPSAAVDDNHTITLTELIIVFAVGVMMLAALILWLFLIPRLSIVLPAKALEIPDVTMRKVWHATRGQTWRLACANFLTLLPLLLTEAIYVLWLGDVDDRIILASGRALNFFVTTLVGIVVTSYNALAYRHFFETDGTAFNPRL
jgi:hypothetical protein